MKARSANKIADQTAQPTTGIVTLEELRDKAKSNNSCADGQYGYAKSLQMDAEDSGAKLSDMAAWEKAGKALR